MDEPRSALDGIGRRMLGGARLDPAAFEEVAEDTSATQQVIFIVWLVGVVGGFVGVASGFPIAFTLPDSWGIPLLGVSLGVGLETVSWLVWSGLAYAAAGVLAGSGSARPQWGAYLRATGIAQVPGLLVILVLFSDSPFLPAWAAAGWRVAAMAIATRSTFGFTAIGRPAMAALAGFLIIMVVVVLIASLTGAGGSAAT